MNLYLRLLCYIRPYRTSFAVSLAAMAIVSVGNLIPTIIAGRVFIDQIIAHRDISRLHWVALILIGIHLIKGIAIMIAEWLSHEIAEHIIFDMRTQIYTHLQKLSYRFHKDNSTGELMSRVVNDIDALRDMLAHSPNMLVVNLLTFIGIGIFLFMENWQLALVAVVPVPFIGFIMVKFGVKLRRIYDDVRAKLGDVNARLQDNLSGIFEIKSFAREPYEAARFTGQCSDYRASIIRGIRLWMRVSPTVQFALGASWTAILWYGSWQIISGKADMTIGSLFIFLGFLWRLFIPIEMVSHEIERLQKALAAGARMINLLNVEPDIQERSQAVNREIQGEIVFEDVSFKYTNEDVLQEINLKVRAGETIALVGPSGVGKTTLVGLVPRFYDVGSGRVYIDGVDVCSWKLHSLRSQIGLVPQETFLFNGTIHENIAYGKLEATQAEVERAAHCGKYLRFHYEFARDF